MSLPHARGHEGSAATRAEAISYLPLVHTLARRLARRLPAHVELEDLVSAGVVGLMEALHRFDATRSSAFRPYAATRIRGAMLDELRRRDLMARDARALTKRVAEATQRLHQALGRSPEDEELAQELGMALPHFLDMLQKIAPLAQISLEDFETEQADLQRPSPHEATLERQLQRKLAENIARLPQRTQDVLHLYYAMELTLAEVGEVIGVSESRVSQIITRTTLELQAMMAEPEGRVYRGKLPPKESA